ncbi:nephrocystin-1-like isoform X4 [Argopecten irradians]|uniref:nephrocystin-1-like isoform X4 n=1 Tax=Argopecten irradians TaxID=31199 RepID=UPI00371C223C
MAPKEPTPLVKVQKEADKLKKQIDKQVKDSNKTASNSKTKNDEVKLKEAFKGCFDLIEPVETLLAEAEALEEANEPPKFKGFDNKKKHEVNRITAWKGQLETAMSKLLPDEKGETYLKELKGEEEEEEEEEVDDSKDEELETTEMLDTQQTETEEPKAGPSKSKKKKEEEEEEEEEDDEDDEEDDDEVEYETDGTTMRTDAPTMKTEADEDEEEDDDEEEYEEEEVEEEEDEEEEEEGEEEEVEEEEDEEEAEEEEVDEEEDETEHKEKVEDVNLGVTISGQQFEAISDFKGDAEGDLSFVKGDILTILDTRDDGWWEAENAAGESGVVPSTYLKMHNKYKDIQKDDEGEEDEEDEEEPGTAKSGKKLWSPIKKAVQESIAKRGMRLHKTSVTDVLHALGAVPSGFRPSTLGPKFQDDEKFTMKRYLVPKLAPSNLAYADLFFDPKVGKIRPRPSRIERLVSVVACRQIPVPGTGLSIKGRHVRVCLFDGQNILSNIHTIKVATVDKDQRTWNFNSREYNQMDPIQHAEFFIRTNSAHENIGILFELCMSYVRTLKQENEENSTEEYGEFSCGWHHLKLLEENGNVKGNRQFDQMEVHGGTPYEKGVFVDPEISRRTSSNAFMTLLSGNKQPRLHVKLAIPNKKEVKDQLQTLPDVFVGSMCLLPFYSFYRQILADKLIRDRIDPDSTEFMPSTELIHSPVLTTFPQIADQSDMMKVVRDLWQKKIKTVKKADSSSIFLPSYLSVMRDHEYMKKLFEEVVKESVYPLLHSTTLPPYMIGNHQAEQARHAEIEKFLNLRDSRGGILQLMLSSEIEFSPFEPKELSFDVIGPHCLQP